MKELTPKQAAFVREYLIDLNATQAAIRAGYSQKTANRIGTENLSKPVIAEAVQAAMKDREQRTEITADLVLRQIQDDRATAIELEQMTVAMKANELLGKHIAMFTEKHELSGPGGGNLKIVVKPPEIDEQ